MRRVGPVPGKAKEVTCDCMRNFKEVLRVLIIRDQLMLGWKIGFFIICGALVLGSMTLMRVNIRSVEINGTVTSHRSETTESGTVGYLIVRLDNGQTIEARYLGPRNYRPGQRAVVKEVTTNFFGLKKHEFKGYMDKPLGD
jgi:hypothetical protein